MVTITVLKLALLPALAFAAAAYVFALPPLWIALVTLHAAMPVGANAFLFAARYERSSATISAAIAISTVVAVLTLSLLLLALQPIIGR
jgi:predicted permease